MKASTLYVKPASPTPSYAGSPRSFQRDTERGKRFYGAEKFYSEGAQTSADEQPKHHKEHVPAHTAKAMHR